MTDIFTTKPTTATYQQLLPSSSYNFGIVLARLPVPESGAKVRRLAAMVNRIASGTSYVSLALYRLEPYGAQGREVSDLDLTRRAFRRVDGIGTAPTVAVVAGNPIHADRDLARELRLTEDVYFVALQASDTSVLTLAAEAATLTNASRNLTAGILTQEVPASMGAFPTELRWGGAYTPMPLIGAYDTAGAYLSLVHSL